MALFTKRRDLRTRLVSQHSKATWTNLGVLVAIGLTASWVANVALAESAGPDLVVPTDAPPRLYHYAHGVEILAVMAAGVLAALKGRFRILNFWCRLAFPVLFLAAAGWAVASYTVAEILSPAVFGATGPFVWFTLILVLAGTDRRVWTLIDPLIRILTVGSTILAVWFLLYSGRSFYPAVGRPEGFVKPTAYTIQLMWMGGLMLLSATRVRGWRLAANAVPLLVMLATAIYIQARSWTILASLLGLTFVILRAREHGSILSGVRTAFLVCVIGVFAAAATYDTILKSALTGLLARADDDTRSNQYEAFFSAVPISDLLVGRGPKGTWYWDRFFGEYQGFDNGYLSTLFFGGLPTLLPYVMIVLSPAIRLLGKNSRGRDAAAVCVVLFWGLAQTGLSTFSGPGVSLGPYLVSLCAGRCHLILDEKARLQRERRPPGQLVRFRSPSRHMAIASRKVRER